ncbi:unnamed protein product [Ectocarpus sp. 12 AP-2014]
MQASSSLFCVADFGPGALALFCHLSDVMVEKGVVCTAAPLACSSEHTTDGWPPEDSSCAQERWTLLARLLSFPSGQPPPAMQSYRDHMSCLFVMVRAAL